MRKVYFEYFPKCVLVGDPEKTQRADRHVDIDRVEIAPKLSCRLASREYPLDDPDDAFVDITEWSCRIQVLACVDSLYGYQSDKCFVHVVVVEALLDEVAKRAFALLGFKREIGFDGAN